MVQRYTFPRLENHIYKKGHFQYIYIHARRAENYNVRIYYTKVNEENGRFAFIATKKIGNAVFRNQCRRRLKEIIRVNRHQMNRGFDIILYAKRKLMEIPFEQSEEAVMQLLGQRGLLIGPSI